MGMVNPIVKLAQEQHGIDALPDKVTGIKIEPELRPRIDSFQGLLCRLNIVGDLRRMHFEGEANPLLAKGIQDRVPTLREQLKPLFVGFLVIRWENVPLSPYARSCEA